LLPSRYNSSLAHGESGIRRKAMLKTLKRLLKKDEGVTAIEYGLIAALIAIVIIVAVTAVGDSLQATFEDVAAALGN